MHTMQRITETVARNLKAAMDYRKIENQPALARISGISQTTISTILRHSNAVSIDRLDKLASSLGYEAWMFLLPCEAFRAALDGGAVEMFNSLLRLPQAQRASVLNILRSLEVAALQSEYIE